MSPTRSNSSQVTERRSFCIWFCKHLVSWILWVIAAWYHWYFVFDPVRVYQSNIDVNLVYWGKFGRYSCCWINRCSCPVYNIYNLQLKYREASYLWGCYCHCGCYSKKLGCYRQCGYYNKKLGCYSKQLRFAQLLVTFWKFTPLSSTTNSHFAPIGQATSLHSATYGTRSVFNII